MRFLRHILLVFAAALLSPLPYSRAQDAMPPSEPAPPASSPASSSDSKTADAAPSPASTPSAPRPSAPPASAAAKPATATAPTPADFDELYEYGRQLFDDYAPATIKDQYEFVSKDQWDTFTARLQTSLESGSVADLAALETDARRTLAALRMMPAYSEYADWLAERLDLMETARLVTHFPPALRPAPAPDHTKKPDSPAPPSGPPPAVAFSPPPRSPVPFYDIWLGRLRDRPKPANADELMPVLKVIFNAEGLPPQLVWLAEVESSFNPSARSPAGARGLFQLMPATAKAYGLRTFPFDERTQPGKNARAAAKLLRDLHDRFHSWPLALAAFNAGEGRVAVAQKKAGSTAYADIAELLPAETRMYVPKVLATVAVREKNVPASLAVPNTPTPVAARSNPFFPTALVGDE